MASAPDEIMPWGLMHEMPSASDALLGFEDIAQWQVQGGNKSSNTDFRTDGEASLEVTGKHMIFVRSPALAPELFMGTGELELDIFLPEIAAGDAETLYVYLSCASANIYYAELGERNFRWAPRNQFNRIRQQIPENVVQRLADIRELENRDPDDCRITLLLNSTADDARRWRFDRLRFH